MDLPESRLYSSTMTSDGKRGECRSCTRQYERERKARSKSDPQYKRSVRVIPNKRGNDSYLVAMVRSGMHTHDRLVRNIAPKAG